MKNILIVNLRRLGDVYSTGHLINSLVKSEGVNITLLTYKESSKAAKNLKHISKLYTIDREEIITLKNNKLFSDGLALEHLFDSLQEIKSTHWDEVINYSNDLIGAYICSYIQQSADKLVGVRFNSERKVITGSDWEMLFNDILPIVQYPPVHFVDCYHKMMNCTASREGEKVYTNSKHNATAFNNMNTIRKGQTGFENTAKIIGIQLKSSSTLKDIPEETLTELIKLIRMNPEMVPVLLIAPTEEERGFANLLNEKFDNDLVIIEADLEAIASILMNIDLLVTPDTAIKHIADLAETPVLEISLGYAPFLKQGCYAEGSMVLTDIITNRDFSSTSNISETQINAHDILASILYFFSKTKTIKPRLSKDVTLYTCSFDKFGARYTVAAGSFDTSIEIYRLMSRQFINMAFDNQESPEIYNDVIQFGTSPASSWCNREKIILTNAMKDLLGTLRSLIQSLENRNSSREFVINLGKLITHSETKSIVQIPVTMFKTKIESIQSKSFEENAKEVELLLYGLKTDIQKILHCIKHLEEKIATQKKVDFVSRGMEQANN